jgi:hypothetical protein
MPRAGEATTVNLTREPARVPAPEVAGPVALTPAAAVPELGAPQRAAAESAAVPLEGRSRGETGAPLPEDAGAGVVLPRAVEEGAEEMRSAVLAVLLVGLMARSAAWEMFATPASVARIRPARDQTCV